MGKLLTGEVNPSGRTVDTFAYNNFDTPAMQNFMLGGAIVSCAGELTRLRFVPIAAAIFYSVALANHLVETAYPLADVLTKVPFFGGSPTLAITFAVLFGVVAVVQAAASFMEHNK